MAYLTKTVPLAGVDAIFEVEMPPFELFWTVRSHVHPDMKQEAAEKPDSLFALG